MNKKLIFYSFIFIIIFSTLIFQAHGQKGNTSTNINTLTEQEMKEGWKLLFDGKTLDGWEMRREGSWRIEDGTISRVKGGYLWTKERYGDFILDCEFKISPKCNSGIFFRTYDTNDPVQTGFEMQVQDSFGKKNIGTHDCGSLYDCLTPRVNAAKPTGEWNNVVLICKDNLITIVLNNQLIINMDLNNWTESNKNPDGTKNKFKTALKDFAREGHIGLQDHGSPVWFRSIKIKEL